MTDTQKAAAVARDLASAKSSFAIARKALQSALADCLPREGAEDRLIHFADEYGVEHALKTLTGNPAHFDAARPLQRNDLADVRKALEAAYAANHRVDTLMAEQERLETVRNPSHVKALHVAGREVIVDVTRQTLVDRESGKTALVGVEHVDAETEWSHERDERDL